MTLQALTDLRQFDANNGAHGDRVQWAINQRLETRQQCRLEMVAQYRAQQFV
ncbi:hypothetical protein D3C73_1658560 [compost metagenome]